MRTRRDEVMRTEFWMSLTRRHEDTKTVVWLYSFVCFVASCEKNLGVFGPRKPLRRTDYTEGTD